jgi:hypothetical protein
MESFMWVFKVIGFIPKIGEMLVWFSFLYFCLVSLSVLIWRLVKRPSSVRASSSMMRQYISILSVSSIFFAFGELMLVVDRVSAVLLIAWKFEYNDCFVHLNTDTVIFFYEATVMFLGINFACLFFVSKNTRARNLFFISMAINIISMITVGVLLTFARC